MHERNHSKVERLFLRGLHIHQHADSKTIAGNLVPITHWLFDTSAIAKSSAYDGTYYRRSTDHIHETHTCTFYHTANSDYILHRLPQRWGTRNTRSLSIMTNFCVICWYFPSNNNSLIKLHIAVSHLPQQKNDIRTHKSWNRRLFFLLCFTIWCTKLRMTNIHMRSKEFCGLFVSSMICRHLYSLTICFFVVPRFFSNFTLILT